MLRERNKSEISCIAFLCSSAYIDSNFALALSVCLESGMGKRHGTAKAITCLISFFDFSDFFWGGGEGLGPAAFLARPFICSSCN